MQRRAAALEPYVSCFVHVVRTVVSAGSAYFTKGTYFTFYTGHAAHAGRASSVQTYPPLDSDGAAPPDVASAEAPRLASTPTRAA